MKTTKRTCEACNMIARGVKFRREPRHTCDTHKPTDNHQWVKDESYKDSTFKARHVCKLCDCERLMSYCGREKMYIYSRGMATAMMYRPDCMDFRDTEGLNKID